jgi:hypothetical protein
MIERLTFHKRTFSGLINHSLLKILIPVGILLSFLIMYGTISFAPPVYKRAFEKEDDTPSWVLKNDPDYFEWIEIHGRIEAAISSNDMISIKKMWEYLAEKNNKWKVESEARFQRIISKCTEEALDSKGAVNSWYGRKVRDMGNLFQDAIYSKFLFKGMKPLDLSFEEFSKFAVSHGYSRIVEGKELRQSFKTITFYEPVVEKQRRRKFDGKKLHCSINGSGEIKDVTICIGDLKESGKASTVNYSPYEQEAHLNFQKEICSNPDPVFKEVLASFFESELDEVIDHIQVMAVGKVTGFLGPSERQGCSSHFTTKTGKYIFFTCSSGAVYMEIMTKETKKIEDEFTQWKYERDGCPMF